MFLDLEDDDFDPVQELSAILGRANQFIIGPTWQAALFAKKADTHSVRHSFVALSEGHGKPIFGCITARPRAARSTKLNLVDAFIGQFLLTDGMDISDLDYSDQGERGSPREGVDPGVLLDFSASLSKMLDSDIVKFATRDGDVGSFADPLTVIAGYLYGPDNAVVAMKKWGNLLTWSIGPADLLTDWWRGLSPAEFAATQLLQDYKHRKVTPTLLRALELMAGVGLDENYSFQVTKTLLASDTLPIEWLPTVPLAQLQGGDPDIEAMMEWEAFFQVMYFSEPVGHVLHRSTRDIVRGFSGSWLGYAADLASLAGYDGDEPSTDFYMATRFLSDAVKSFIDQVARPLHEANGRYCSDALFEVESPGGIGLHAGEVYRILMGNKSLSGMIEFAAKWHTYSTKLSEVELSIGADLKIDWPLHYQSISFQGNDGAVYAVVPLNSALQYLDEGRSGVDSGGVEGMDHCIASYASRCFGRNDNFVVSVRQLSPVRRRLSTALIEAQGGNLSVVQHHGMRNARPPEISSHLLKSFFDNVAPHDDRNWSTARQKFSCLYDPRVPGAIDTMLAAWSPLLSKPMRSLTAEGLLAKFRHVKRDKDDAFLTPLDGGPPVAEGTEYLMPPDENSEHPRISMSP